MCSEVDRASESARQYPSDRADELANEQWIRKAFAGVAECGVECATTVVLLTPGDRVIAIHAGAARGVAALVEREQDVHLRPWIALEGVPLVRAVPRIRQPGRRRAGSVFHDHVGGLNRWVLAKIGPDEPAVPGPVVLRVRRRVNADEAFARADEALEGRLLGVVEHVARRTQENHRVVSREALV